MVKTKIICTIGPASDAQTILRKMMLSGMDVARLNFSHGTHQAHKKRIDTIRGLNNKYRRHIRILQDLEGHRIRIGALTKDVVLKKRQVVYLANKKIPGKEIIPFDYFSDLGGIKKGTHIFIDDGTIELVVLKGSRYYLEAQIEVSGVLKEHKGVNIPDAHLDFKGLTDKDKLNLEFGVKNRVDYVAQSFVRSAADIIVLKHFLGSRLPQCKIIAKIENREGIKNIDSIIKVSDGIMIARGDMGISIPIYEVPMVQKEIIRKCNKAGKFVITATQMLESMTENIRPTRAEVADVANAILDGTDFVMLSGETAAGKYPVEAVKMMNDIIKFTEHSASTIPPTRWNGTGDGR